MDRLKDRVTIVTGGAHGIGRAYCEGLAHEGARVVVADIDGRGAEVVAEALSVGGQEALAVQADVSLPDATYMKQQRRGKIVNISSGTVFFGAALLAHYVTSKAGVIGFTRTLARELGEYNINVNAIAPGLTMSMDVVDEAREALQQQRLQARAIKRPEVPQDLVGTAVFLCSSDSDFMTGQTLVVDGGAQMH